MTRHIYENPERERAINNFKRNLSIGSVSKIKTLLRLKFSENVSYTAIAVSGVTFILKQVPIVGAAAGGAAGAIGGAARTRLFRRRAEAARIDLDLERELRDTLKTTNLNEILGLQKNVAFLMDEYAKKCSVIQHGRHSHLRTVDCGTAKELYIAFLKADAQVRKLMLQSYHLNRITNNLLKITVEAHDKLHGDGFGTEPFSLEEALETAIFESGCSGEGRCSAGAECVCPSTDHAARSSSGRGGVRGRLRRLFRRRHTGYLALEE